MLPKSEQILLRVEKPVKEKLEKLASAWSMSLSGTVRRLIIEAKIPKEDM